MKKIVSIDLGSNSFRVLVYDGLKHKILDEYQEVVGMADGLTKTGLISNDAQERVIKAVKNSIEKLNYDPSQAVCVTTAAMRKAKNSKEVLKRFKDECKLNFKIINGEEEARLTLLAIKYALKREKVEANDFVLVDIGGGSTELIYSKCEEYFSKSFDLGIVTLAQMSISHEHLISHLETKAKEIRQWTKHLNLEDKEFTFVATAGTPTTIAAVKLGLDFSSYDKDLVNGTTLTVDEVLTFFKNFEHLTKEESLKLVGSGRVDFIKSGTLIYKLFYEILNKDISIVFDDGLREGVAINEALKA